MLANTLPRPVVAFGPVLLAAVALMAAALVLPGQSNAVGVAGCSVSPHRPYIVVSGGVRIAKAHIYVTCTVGRSGILTKRILEQDPGADDEVARRTESFTIQAGTTQGFVITGVCRDFDPIGAEELVTEGQLHIGVNSPKAHSPSVSVTC
jgi:hypothetical protein